MENTNNSLNTNQNNMLESIIGRKSTAPIPIYSSKRNSYPELHLFKNQIEVDGNGPLHKPYSKEKSNVMLYRTVFLSIGVLYFLLALVLFTKSLTWTCSVLFGSCFLIKTVLCSLCSISSIYCIALGFLIKSEKEAVKKVFAQSKARLGKAYERKAVKYGIKTFFAFGDEQRKSLALKQIYFEALEKLQEYKEETMHILSRITNTDTLDGNKKEELYNQAILEFKDKMELVVNSFKTTNPLKLQHH